MLDYDKPESVAGSIFRGLPNVRINHPDWTDEQLCAWVQGEVERAVKTAKRAERAACADLALSRTYEGRDDGDTARRIAAAIKTRGWQKEHGYYMVAHLPQDKIESLATLRAVFDDTTDYASHWLFLSTSGVHGSYTCLDDISRDAQRLDNGNCWDPAHEVDCECGAEWDDDNHPYVYPDGSFRITALMLKPRIVQAAYGTVWATIDDIPWLRNVVERTLQGVETSQQGNLRETAPPDSSAAAEFLQQYERLQAGDLSKVREITTADLPAERYFQSEEAREAIYALHPFKLVVTAEDLLPKRNPWNPLASDLKVDIDVIRLAQDIDYHHEGRVLHLKSRSRMEEDDRA